MLVSSYRSSGPSYGQPITRTPSMVQPARMSGAHDAIIGTQVAGGVVQNVEYRNISGPGVTTAGPQLSTVPYTPAAMTRPGTVSARPQTEYPGFPLPSVCTLSAPTLLAKLSCNICTRSLLRPRFSPVDPVQQGIHTHIPTGDGFTSPYESLPQNLNRNPYFKSWYDVPVELRTSQKPPPDFVISQHDPEHQYLQRGNDYAPQGRLSTLPHILTPISKLSSPGSHNPL